MPLKTWTNPGAGAAARAAALRARDVGGQPLPRQGGQRLGEGGLRLRLAVVGSRGASAKGEQPRAAGCWPTAILFIVGCLGPFAPIIMASYTIETQAAVFNASSSMMFTPII